MRQELDKVQQMLKKLKACAFACAIVWIVTIVVGVATANILYDAAANHNWERKQVTNGKAADPRTRDHVATPEPPTSEPETSVPETSVWNAGHVRLPPRAHTSTQDAWREGIMEEVARQLGALQVVRGKTFPIKRFYPHDNHRPGGHMVLDGACPENTVLTALDYTMWLDWKSPMVSGYQLIYYCTELLTNLRIGG